MNEEMLYKKMYLSLFNGVTDALAVIDKQPKQAEKLLQQAQLNCEEIFVSADEELRSEIRYGHDKGISWVRFI